MYYFMFGGIIKSFFQEVGEVSQGIVPELTHLHSSFKPYDLHVWAPLDLGT